MGLNFSSLQIARELDLDRNDAGEMVQLLRQGVVDRRPAVVLAGEVECDEVSVVAGHKGDPAAVEKRASGPPATPERWAGPRDVGEEKPPIFGMLQRTGEVVI